MKLSISRKKLFIAFLILVPFWIIAYIISYFIFISDFCHRTWPHDYTRKHCVYIGRKAIQFLEKNPIIGIFTSKKLMKSDFLPQKYVNQVYELLSFIDFVFTKHNIEYSIDFGTELGAIRHGGFIPWDDDIDLLVFSSEKETIDALREEIKNEKMENRFIVIESENNVGSVQWSVIKVKDGIVADLFCNKNIVKCRFDRFDNQERYFLSENGSCDKLVFYPYSFAHDEIWPLKKCAFGPFELPCKNDVVKTFNMYYGDNWKDVLYTENHTFNKGRNKKLKLTKELLSPALPTDDAWKIWIDKKNNLKKQK